MVEQEYSVLMPLAPWEEPWILEGALNSILNQTLAPVEVVISTDGVISEELNKVIEQSGLAVKVVSGPGNEGVGPVLARGSEVVRTEIVVRADSDDINDRKRCAMLVEMLVTKEYLSVVGSRMVEFEQKGKAFKRELKWERICPLTVEGIRRSTRFRNPMNHPTVAFRKSRIIAIGSYRSVSGFEDYDLWCRIVADGGKLMNVDRVLVLARVGKEHRKRRRGIKYVCNEIRFYKKCWDERLMERWWVILMGLARIPIRLMPSCVIGRVMIAAGRRLPQN